MRDIEKLIIKYRKKCKKSKTMKEKVEYIAILEGLVKARDYITNCALKIYGLGENE